MIETQQNGHNFDVYSSIRNNKINSDKGRLSVHERIEIEDKLKDSLRQCCNHTSFFDDSLFHIKNEILLIDTFNFFSASCICKSKHAITVVNKLINLSCTSGKYDIITVQSIRTHKNSFIITLKHSKTEEAVDFKFQLIANYPPKLIEVKRWHLE